MKTLATTLLTLVLCVCSYAQTPEEMKAWQESMTPNEHHKWLASFDGEWIGEVKMWMDPSLPPSVSKIKTKNEMIMNGLYQRSTHSGEMMGQPFNGEGMMGFDNTKKKFVSTWIDNMGSGIMYMEGSMVEGEKILTTYGEMSDPMSGETINVKQVLKVIDDDTHIFEMYMIIGDNETKTMEIMYKRN